jgi:hypothetical protein
LSRRTQLHEVNWYGRMRKVRDEIVASFMACFKCTVRDHFRKETEERRWVLDIGLRIVCLTLDFLNMKQDCQCLTALRIGNAFESCSEVLGSNLGRALDILTGVFVYGVSLPCRFRDDTSITPCRLPLCPHKIIIRSTLYCVAAESVVKCPTNK